MEFLLNNPGIAFMLLIVFAFSIIMISKIINEINFNKLLKFKQKQMRINTQVTYGGGRVAFLSLITATPIIIIVLLVNMTINPMGDLPSGYKSFNSLSSIESVVDDFKSKSDIYYFTRTFSTDDFLDSEIFSNEVAYTTTVGSSDYSTVNNQVIGVAEMDNVVTNGKYIYILNNNLLTILYAYDTVNDYEDMHIIKQIDYSSECEVDAMHPVGLFIDDERLVVVGNTYTAYGCDNSDEGFWFNGSSYGTFIDVYELEDYTLEDQYKLSGVYKGFRKIGDNLIAVTTDYMEYENSEVDVLGSIPNYKINNYSFDIKYNSIVYLEGTMPNAFTTFYGINLEYGSVDTEVILGDGRNNLYVSENNIYLTSYSYSFVPFADILNFESNTSNTKTSINKVSYSGNNLSVEGVGYVEGNTLDQFSMSEYEGNLRIATTKGFRETAQNYLTIFDSNMEVISVLNEGLGEERESLKSSTFFGNYAFVVTFEQTDPFYVIDLNDVENPVIIGELKIPGFSTYLQPLTDDIILGIGFNVDESTNRTTGIKVQLYDVSDMTLPVVMSSVEILYSDYGYSYSSATNNHKDLLVSLSNGIIAFPFTTYTYNSDNYTYISGLIVYNLDLINGLSEKGVVVHETNSIDDIYIYKGIYIDDYLYTISNKYVGVSLIENPDEILKIIDIQKK
ncbi:hypothetical protein CI105_01055 [Candidatus Izimaplasma bacterium ZiA1]|uniref:beta-propeller domain-containing protein n=1 Tax=Candidatus Izimoplasma sp. ZiA1 TaxID=2024899 RepID=UPI000BAA6356|nr:hypothetical protein CI105_01055 [Candidatus Izimaplasma bacterium ZiA1]